MTLSTFNAILLLIFITLRLTGHVAWSWWWVMAPLWIPVLLAALVTLGYYAVTTRKERERDKMRDRLLDYARRIQR